MARTAEQDNVRELQRTLYRAAKADPGRRFHALHDKVVRSDVLERAWGQVRANRGAGGIDRQTITDVERYGVDRLLDEMAADLKDGRWRPLPARRVFIPKPGREELRPLSIPTVRARHTTRSRYSSMRAEAAGGGWSRRTSPTVMRRCHTIG
jgi:RNA-directed DNA polymerase